MERHSRCLYANIGARIGVPHIFVAGPSGSEPEIGAKSYSGMLYTVSTMLSGSTGEIKGIKNAINNIQSIYDDVFEKKPKSLQNLRTS